ncbi:MAG: TrpB-like pyridoxal phosphate-dependent enzyme [Candidatus Latescibacterota bacterium]|nr:MAG: TrpB-like pyridoxal phosphate-dependent enzyme [Candidatus Latescibacterota bacterium]
MEPTKIILNESEMPRRWYNIIADLEHPPLPVLHPGTREPIGPDDLAPIFPMGLIEQEVAQDRYIDIPEEILEAYRIWRPTPLVRAKRLEEALETTAKIYYKNEGVSPTGSHKPNTAVAQAYYNAKEGVKRLTTETGAGQWGSALSFACNVFDLDCKVYMVRVSYEQKPYRKIMMESWGADVVSSPSMHTGAGRMVLGMDPHTSGSLGIAISEAVEDAVSNDETKYSLGSVLNHVLLHQTIIGLEAKQQMEIAGDYPDVVIGCVGGGSNFGGMALPFLQDKLNGKNLRAVAAEPTACPTLTKGAFAYDFGDTARLTPLLPMFTLGHTFVPPAIHAGGLRYHGGSPLLCDLVRKKLIDCRAYQQTEVFDAALVFAKTEGILPAPESSHAIRAAIDEAREATFQGEERTILFCLSGHGHFDLSAYDAFLKGKLEDHEFPEDALEKALENLKEVSN